jgi:hypothetical protein
MGLLVRGTILDSEEQAIWNDAVLNLRKLAATKGYGSLSGYQAAVVLKVITVVLDAEHEGQE